MNDTSIQPSVNRIEILKTKSGFLIQESNSREGYMGEQHSCTTDTDVNMIVAVWTNVKNYN